MPYPHSDFCITLNLQQQLEQTKNNILIHNISNQKLSREDKRSVAFPHVHVHCPYVSLNNTYETSHVHANPVSDVTDKADPFISTQTSP